MHTDVKFLVVIVSLFSDVQRWTSCHMPRSLVILRIRCGKISSSGLQQNSSLTLSLVVIAPTHPSDMVVDIRVRYAGFVTTIGRSQLISHGSRDCVLRVGAVGIQTLSTGHAMRVYGPATAPAGARYMEITSN